MPSVRWTVILPAFSQRLKVSMETPRILEAWPIFTKFADGFFINWINQESKDFKLRLLKSGLLFTKSMHLFLACIDPISSMHRFLIVCQDLLLMINIYNAYTKH